MFPFDDVIMFDTVSICVECNVMVHVDIEKNTYAELPYLKQRRKLTSFIVSLFQVRILDENIRQFVRVI